MIQVRKLSIGQKNQLVNKKFAEDSFFGPAQDGNNIWFISEEEVNFLEEERGFGWIKNLQLIDYVRPDWENP